MNKLEKLLAEAKLAGVKAQGELLRMYPKGSDIYFTIMHGQRNASTGTVGGAGRDDGYLRVKHHQAKPNSRYAYRDVHYSSIVGGSDS